MSGVDRRAAAALRLGVLLAGLVSVAATAAVPAQTTLRLPEDLALTDHTGAPFAVRDVRGKVVLLAFGYTHCPDVCPMTLSVMAQTLRALGTDVDRVAPLFVSLDPARDTPRVLAEYVRYFHPAIVGLTGTEQELKRLTSSLSTGFGVHGDVAGDRYTLDHTANLYVLDAQGRVASIVPFGLPADAVRERIAALLEN
jgi:protein SCO1/2